MYEHKKKEFWVLSPGTEKNLTINSVCILYRVEMLGIFTEKQKIIYNAVLRANR